MATTDDLVKIKFIQNIIMNVIYVLSTATPGPAWSLAHCSVMIEGRLWPGLCPWVLMHHLRVRRRGRGGSEEEGERGE